MGNKYIWKNFIRTRWKDRLLYLLDMMDKIPFSFKSYNSELKLDIQEWNSFARIVASYLKTPEKTIFEMKTKIKETDYNQQISII